MSVRPARPVSAFAVGFILTDDFALMSFASAVEPLRAANLLADRPLYDIRFFAAQPGLVASSVGAVIPVKDLPVPADRLDAVFVVVGGDPARIADDGALKACLRLLARSGTIIGGISGGPYLLAAAGLLAGRRFTIHWEHADALIEQFRDLTPERVRFVIDGDRITCGGGIAPLDLMHAIIASQHGADFARRVSDWFLHTHVDQPAGAQRASVTERYQVHHKVLAKVLEKMETAIEEPLSRADMAAFAGVSERHLDRLFSSVMKSRFSQEYLRIRLERAAVLLKQSPLAVSEIGYATGFSGPSQFTRAFRRHFGESPRALRDRKA